MKFLDCLYENRHKCERSFDTFAHSILVVSCLGALLTFILPGIDAAIARAFPDDALFYNIIARNILAGLGSTSDGIAQSNGYHPLWMMMVIGMEAIPGKPLAYELILLFCINVISTILIYAWLVALVNRRLALIISLLATVEESFFRVTWSGMETSLALLFLLVLLHLLRRGKLDERMRLHPWPLRLLLLLLFFARLDGGLFWVALSLLYLCRPAPTRVLAARAMALFRLFFPALAIVFVYFAFNQWWFGIAMPISGRIKSYPLTVLFTQDKASWIAAWQRFEALVFPDSLQRLAKWMALRMPAISTSIYPAMVIVFTLVLTFAIRELLHRRKGDLALQCFLLYVALHLIYYALFQSANYSLSYTRGPEMLLVWTAAALILDRSKDAEWVNHWRHVIWRTALLLIIASAAGLQLYRAKHTERIYDFSVSRDDFLSATQYVINHIPPNAPIISRNIGFLGYYTGRPVVCEDGLVNSREYYEQFLSKNRVVDYMREHAISWIVNIASKEGDPANFTAAQFPGMLPENVEILAVFDAARDRPKVKFRYIVARYRL